METKEKWNDSDYNIMSWHDSRLYQIKFPNEECDFTLYIDYIFKWVEEKNTYKFWVAPCELIFHNVVNLNLNLTFEKAVGIDIDDISRVNLGLTPNKKFTQWKYKVNTDKGSLIFTTTGFTMNLISKPILSESQSSMG